MQTISRKDREKYELLRLGISTTSKSRRGQRQKMAAIIICSWLCGESCNRSQKFKCTGGPKDVEGERETLLGLR